MFVIGGDFRNFVDIDYRHIGEYLLGAMVAKRQFGLEFDGTQPFPGRFGMSRIRAGYFGLSDDWTDQAISVASTEKVWITSATTELGGTSTLPLKILESAVHVITAIGDYRWYISGNPTEIECFNIEQDGRPKPILPFYLQANLSSWPIVELDEAMLLQNKTTLKINYTTNNVYWGVPFLWGVSFAPEAQLRVADPQSLDGATNDMVIKTG
jgi:hypothetical protein